MARIKTLPPMARPLLTKPATKIKDDVYKTVEYKAWRLAVMTRDGWRCQWRDGAVRCDKRAPAYRLYADHITEIVDGGHPHDVSNGRVLCDVHHKVKGARAKAARAGMRWTKDNA